VVRAVIDTNILVDYLQGVPDAANELAAYGTPAISVISWIEVMVGSSPQTEPSVRAFLASFEQFPVSERVSELAVQLRKSTRIKLPDALIWATAQANGCLLVTRNTRDFDPKSPGVRVPYTV
jgi:predicted nucleic acid-binding protein